MKANASSNPTTQAYNLNTKQGRGIVALLANPKLKDAAEAAGVSEATLWRWLQDKDFHTAYMKARRDAVQGAIARLQSISVEAVETLHEIMSDKTALVFARVTAARTILDYAMKGIELEDLAERVAELEALQAQHKGKR
jgi:AcrR family transcriptional regulator